MIDINNNVSAILPGAKQPDSRKDILRVDIRKIGKKIRHKEELSTEEETIFLGFRRAHKNILTEFRKGIISALSQCPDKEDVVFGSRLKKRNTIYNKIADRMTQMDLCRIQDIAGVRLIFPTVGHLQNFRAEIHRQERDLFPNSIRITADDKYNYILNPKETGYRGIHDVYKTCNVREGVVVPHIEIQYRTRVQHAWATALEIWDSAYARQSKFGLEEEGVKNLFALVSELLWRFSDGGSKSGGVALTNRRLYMAISALQAKIGLFEKLFAIKPVEVVAGESDLKKGRLAPIMLNKTSGLESNGNRSRSSQLKLIRPTEDAYKEYFELEEKGADDDLVLVWSKKANWRTAYNNYLNDLSEFKFALAKSLNEAYRQINRVKRLFVPEISTQWEG